MREISVVRDSVERFSNRVENYVKYRPHYPQAAADLFRNELGIGNDAVVADIGAGTGISSELFLKNGSTVYAIEPNELMREASLKYLEGREKFHSIDGTADAIPLADDLADLVTAGQAFHWFANEAAIAEFKRVLKPGGYIALMWNERQLDSTPFLSGYEQLIKEYSKDYEVIRHDKFDWDSIGRLLGGDVTLATFSNPQVMDLEGIRGRMLSSSYIPTESDERYPEMIKDLDSLFAKHAENDKITVLYDTKVYFSKY